MNRCMLCCLHMTQVQANTTSTEEASIHPVLGFGLVHHWQLLTWNASDPTPTLNVQTCPYFSAHGKEVLCPLLFFNCSFEPCTLQQINLNPTPRKKTELKFTISALPISRFFRREPTQMTEYIIASGLLWWKSPSGQSLKRVTAQESEQH